MTTLRTEKIERLISRRGPLVESIERTQTNLERLAAALNALLAARDQIAPELRDSATARRFAELPLAPLRARVKSELAALRCLSARFKRKVLTIGVVGRPGQGKSRLLQSLSGLGSREIPDGDASHCTGVRSVIYHDSTVEPHALVWFHDEESFLSEVLAPYYRELDLGAAPRSLDEFRSRTLPPLPEHFAAPGVETAKYKHLRDYRRLFDQYASLLRASSPRRIPPGEIREYVAQDDVQGRRVFHNYLAIRQVDIYCTFPREDVGRIALIDMPGLGDTGVGDEERLIHVLGQDVDFVVFVNRPVAQRSIWADVDVKLYAAAHAALAEIPLEQWSFMALNRLAPNIPGGGNEAACVRMAASLPEIKGIAVARCVTADCSNANEVREAVLDPVLDYLTDHLDRLDARYAGSCQHRLQALAVDLTSALESSSAALGSLSAFETEHLKLRALFRGIWRELTTGLEGELRQLRETTAQPDAMLAAETRAALEAGSRDSGIPDIDYIRELRDHEGGYLSAFEKCLHRVRNRLVQHFARLEGTLQNALEAARFQVAQVLRQQGRLAAISDLEGTNFIRLLAKSIPEELPELQTAVQTLASVELTYRGFLQYRIRQHLERLMTDMPRASGAVTAENVREMLEIRYRQTLGQLEGAFKDWLREPNLVAYAVVEEFIDRVLRADRIEDQWEAFYLGMRSTIWKSEFNELGERSRLREQWDAAVRACAEANVEGAFLFAVASEGKPLRQQSAA